MGKRVGAEENNNNNTMQSEIVCRDCRTLLRYPAGASQVRCVVCSSITNVHPPPQQQQLSSQHHRTPAQQHISSAPTTRKFVSLLIGKHAHRHHDHFSLFLFFRVRSSLSLSSFLLPFLLNVLLMLPRHYSFSLSLFCLGLRDGQHDEQKQIT